ncbi:Down syndrome cell adhesion molecule homolog [Strongylocentrotus purpuratus]|uniref:Fibronectin type-III domain-containing protein n=1 Tax=Strongylocentrotus purpuratus TaxID=7668 RepID=A0A7M7T2I4_STRPU|nr:Down syndrome cell adhesion molecule homolog [Strongylocentrotus purpuratus]
MEAPLITNLSSNNVAIRWTNHYQGDGPICGYGINIKKNDDKDRGDVESSDPWRSVGYVSVESGLLYDVGHLEANTTYQVVVSPINCISTRESPREPILQCTTKTVALPVVAVPRLLTLPQVKDVTTATIKIEWKGDYDGDGPICGFVVEIRPPASTSWTSVGFVSFDEDEDVFDYTIERLNSNTLYGISVIILHCSGREGERGFEFYQSTKGREPQTKPPSISTSTAPPCPAQKWRECPQNPPKDEYPWKMMFFIALIIIFLILVVIIGICCT